MNAEELKIFIPGPSGKLETQIIRRKDIQNKDIGVIICHPHPQYGGTMAFPVVRIIYKGFGNLGYTSLRFNFRGVGKSEGTHGNGAGEREDLISVCNFMLNENFGVKKLLIIGYSFGATIGASIADEFDEIIGYVAISYPFSLIPQFISQAYVNKPKFFIMGENDDFTSLPILKKEYEKMPEPKDIRIFKGIDHFWSESEEILANAIFEWFKKNFLK